MGPAATLPPFTLHRLVTLADALRLLAERGDDAHPIAGGTELLLVLRAGVMEVSDLIDLKRIAGMTSIWHTAGLLHIGGAVRHVHLERTLRRDGVLPALATAERRVGNPRVRATGTLGGNVCFAEPHSDPATALLAYGARVTLQSIEGEREVAMDDFVLGPIETVRRRDEILTKITIPLEEDRRSGYVRHATAERPTAGVAVAFDDSGRRAPRARIAVGCVAGRPILLPHAQSVIDQHAGPLTAEVIGRAADAAAAEVEPVEDEYGPADYKRHIVGVLVRRAFEAALRA